MNKFTFVIGVLLITFSSCYYDKEEDLYGLECDTNNLTYSKNLEKIINESCATSGCHDSGSNNSDYSSYNKVVIDTGIIIERTIIEKTMPPSSNLSECNFKLIAEWIKQGAKE